MSDTNVTEMPHVGEDNQVRSFFRVSTSSPDDLAILPTEHYLEAMKTPIVTKTHAEILLEALVVIIKPWKQLTSFSRH